MIELWLSQRGYFVIVDEGGMDLISDTHLVRFDIGRPKNYKSVLKGLGYKFLEVIM